MFEQNLQSKNMAKGKKVGGMSGGFGRASMFVAAMIGMGGMGVGRAAMAHEQNINVQGSTNAPSSPQVNQSTQNQYTSPRRLVRTDSSKPFARLYGDRPQIHAKRKGNRLHTSKRTKRKHGK